MGEIIQKVCPVCKTAFQTEKRNNRRYCSAECRQKGLAMRRFHRNNGLCKLDVRQLIETICDDGVDKLKATIIAQAIKDYKKALKKCKGKSLVSICKNFFLLSWGQSLSDNNGYYIIKHCIENER